jgi:hypothetical protein
MKTMMNTMIPRTIMEAFFAGIDYARQWQPIQTVPKDGTYIWLSDGWSIRVGYWYVVTKDASQEHWADFAKAEACGPRDLAFEPTYWMPTPKPPIAAKAMIEAMGCGSHAGMYVNAVSEYQRSLTEEEGTWPHPKLRKNYSFHWLHAERASSPSIAQWVDNRWVGMNETGPITPAEMKRRGWEYLGPVDGRPHSEYLDK